MLVQLQRVTPMRDLMVRDIVANDVAAEFDSPIPHQFTIVWPSS